MRSIPIRLASCTALFVCIIGCAHVGQEPSSSVVEPSKPVPVALRHVAEIRPGTPIRVFTRDGDSTAGFFLGATDLDASGISGRAPAIRLGVGDPEKSSRMFESGSMLSASTIQLRDTVVFAMNRVKKVLVPGQFVPPPRRSGLATVMSVLVVLGTLLALVAVIATPRGNVD